MKRFWNTNFFIILFVIIGLLSIYRQVIFDGKILFPSNFLAQFYSPWRTEKFSGWEVGIPHKPIGDDQIRIFYPERTIICMSPAFLKSSNKSLPRDAFSPTRSPPASEECGSPRTDSRLLINLFFKLNNFNEK